MRFDRRLFQGILGPVAALAIIGVVVAVSPARFVSATTAQLPVSAAWTQLAPPTSPPARFAAAMDYDAATGTTVLFGGSPNDSVGAASFADTWTFDGANWTRKNPASSPAARSGARMVYDPVRREIVLFGGCCDPNGGKFGDTWTWDGTNWTNQKPATSPPARTFPGMAFDAAQGNVVLFGGCCGTAALCGPDPGELSDTWIWDGTTWTQRFPSRGPQPGPRQRAGVAYLASTSTVVMYGGLTCLNSDSDTWTWDGTTWTLAARGLPPGLNGPTMDEQSTCAVDALFGGAAGTGGHNKNNTWIWDGANWFQMQPHHPLPVARNRAAMAYQSSRGTAVLFGGCCRPDPIVATQNDGLADTWVLSVACPRAYMPIIFKSPRH
ncbi:MAG TPA: kelch repeat-containing protein [Chloroflexota bacterium]|nr:kelch repeat-containing protein [Chloroflexota bacterium]